MLVSAASTTIKVIVLLTVLILAAGLTPASPNLVLEPSYSYINFDVSLANSTSTLVFANHSMFVMARKCKRIRASRSRRGCGVRVAPAQPL